MNPIAGLPPAPVYVAGDPNYAAAFNAWRNAAEDALMQYRAEYAERMAASGISVTWSADPAATSGPYALPPVYKATLSKDGYSSESLVSLGRAINADPSDLADFDAAFNLRFQGQVNNVTGNFYGPPGTNPGTGGFFSNPLYNPPTVNPFFSNEPYSTPGPATTVPTGSGSMATQHTQSPATPDQGTQVSNPATSEPGAVTPTNPNQKYTFWEWNWFNERDSGRVGPSPEAVGVADGNTLMTRAEWLAATSAWFLTGGATTGGDGGGATSGGGGGTGNSGGSGEPGGVITAPNGEIRPEAITAGILAGAILVLRFIR